ncbi:MAG TPA: ATP-binding protein [Verrucomicrobiae bacterium]|nr:ATP-binding protein [Verrucomicrobiae bacterium]
MKTVLVLASHPELPESVRAALNPEKYRLVHRIDVSEAEPLLSRGMVDVCIVEVEQTQAQGIWMVEKICRRLPKCPVLVYSGSRDWQWEEEAYLQGVQHVLVKPVRPRLLNLLLDRFWKAPVQAPSDTRPPFATTPVEGSIAPRSQPHTPVQALGILRDFSGILTHSLCAEALLRQFLLMLREILGVNRAAVFLRQPITLFGVSPSPEENRRMRSACAIGLSQGLLEHFELSFESGLGGYLFREGKIIRRHSPDALSDVEIRKEFEILGAQVAIPILDRETLVGVAAFDGRVTGEPLANGELELIFHLLEELGLAVKNIWLHDQLAASHSMLTDVLKELSSGCVVVSGDLIILHANRSARRMFHRGGQRSAEMDFTDLPQEVGSMVYRVLKTGAGSSTERYSPPDLPNAIFQVSVIPFAREGGGLPRAALLVAEDQTQAEALRKLENEASNLRLVKSMADRIAHEVGNAMVPISTHQQLLTERFKDQEFRASLDHAMSEGVKRVSRLINQMRYLARDAVLSREAVPLSQLIEEAYREAQKHQPAKSGKLNFDNGAHPIILSGDRQALRHALAEVFLNALQANASDAKVAVRAQTESDAHGTEWVHIEVVDNGTGFTPEAAQKAPTPFFTTRTVGLGLGLCVTRKIVECHLGRLTIPGAGKPGTVRISLPMALETNN